MFPFINPSTSEKLRPIKEKYDKFFTLIISSLTVLSTLWDIIRFHCYWSDYMLELYSCFFLTFMSLYFIIPGKIPKIISDNIGVIKTSLGRSITMIFFSLLFLADEHLFHKLCAIFLFIGGTVLLIMELISPEKKNEQKYYEANEHTDKSREKKNEENSQNDSNPPTKLDDDSQPHGIDNLNDSNKNNNFDDLNKENNNNGNNMIDDNNTNNDNKEQAQQQDFNFEQN